MQKEKKNIFTRTYKIGNFEVRGNTVLLIFATPILINYFLLTWRAPFVFGDANSWLGFLANYSGGIIGGLVAFFAAKIQMDFQKEREKLQRYLAQLPTLTKLSLELTKMKLQFEVSKDIPKNLPPDMPDEVKNNIHKSSLTLEPLIRERWGNLDVIQDPILLSELYKLFESYERTVEVLGFNLTELELSIKKRELEKDKLEKKLKKGRANEVEKIDFELLCHNLQNDMLRHKVLEADKRHYWSILGNAFVKANDLEQRVNTLIEEIKGKTKEQKAM
ncbi:hypothetical protein [Brevibacillus brevis]|uniref:Uncharacterized protein n=1 Tax=Brevibacillus brevis TaxID=1393 RepID=A0A517IAF4_BREBE|nr:hypothetical protein [Brevibacillus brevis]QDS35852.1 hypothetical protein FPS98_18535 [Brevibacillus brevis]